MAVMMSTLIFGNFMGRVSTLLCPPTAKDKAELRSYSQIGADAIRLTRLTQNHPRTVSHNTSHYELMVHPNEEKDPDDSVRASMLLSAAGSSAASWATSKFVQWFATFDE